jgi:divalent metal cation (Fe/Co/Zn/Cd) transporter
LETSAPLLGEAPDPELVNEIQDRILGYEGVLGLHDLVVHSYGPSRIFASVHIEVDAHGDMIASHNMIDAIERSIAETMKIQIVAHMDPLDTQDPLTVQVKSKLFEAISSLEGIIGLHDLRVVSEYPHHNVIFDVVIGSECKMEEEELKKLFDSQLKELSPNFFSVITVDRSYSN